MTTLVFAPIKKEFRALKRLVNAHRADLVRMGRAVEIYTPGNEDVVPQRFNPLELLPGVTSTQHIDLLRDCLHAAMPLSGPLPGILEEALEDIYDRLPHPTVADWLQAAEQALQRKEYSSSTYADLRGALDVRLGSLLRGGIGQVFRCESSNPSITRLLTNNTTVIEMENLPPEQACLLTLFLLVHICEAIRVLPKPAAIPRIVLVFEEAHRLVGANTNAAPSEDNPDPKAYAAEFVSRMLAEMRALGVGIVIGDQSPSAVATEVIKHTGTKLAFQQLHESDRIAIGAAMLFGTTEYQDIARLRPGEAYLFTSGFYSPCKIRTVNLHEELDLEPLTDDELRMIVHNEPWYVEMTHARVEMSVNALRSRMDVFDATRIRCVSNAARLCAVYPQAAGISDITRRKDALTALKREASALRCQLNEAFRQFRLRDYLSLLPSEDTAAVVGIELGQLRADLITRYEMIIKKDTNQCLAILGKLIENCGTLHNQKEIV